MAGIIEKIFKSPILTWWNSEGVGTRFTTWRKGEKVGEDQQGNIYYRERGGKRRWVIYRNGPVEASRVPAEWHGWLHYMTDELPTEVDYSAKEWEQEHQANMTGSKDAYRPTGSMLSEGERTKTASDYEAWQPGN